MAQACHARNDCMKTWVGAASFLLLLLCGCAISGEFPEGLAAEAFSNGSISFAYPAKGYLESPPEAVDAVISYLSERGSPLSAITLSSYSASEYQSAEEVARSWAERFYVGGGPRLPVTRSWAGKTEAALFEVESDSPGGVVRFTGAVPCSPVNGKFWMLLVQSKPGKGSAARSSAIAEAVLSSLSAGTGEGAPLSFFGDAFFAFSYPYTSEKIESGPGDMLLLTARYQQGSDIRQISLFRQKGFASAMSVAMGFLAQAGCYGWQASVGRADINGAGFVLVEETRVLDGGLFEARTTAIAEAACEGSYYCLQVVCAPQKDPKAHSRKTLNGVLGSVGVMRE